MNGTTRCFEWRLACGGSVVSVAVGAVHFPPRPVRRRTWKGHRRSGTNTSTKDTSMNAISKGLLILALASGPITANAALSAVTAAKDSSPLVYDSLNNATWPANTNLFGSQYSAATVQAIEHAAVGLPSLKGYTLTDADFNSTGTMTWYGALAWVSYLNVINYGGSSHWSLPKSITGQDIAGYPDGIGTDA